MSDIKITAPDVTSALAVKLANVMPEVTGWRNGNVAALEDRTVTVESAYWRGPTLRVRLSNGQEFLAVWAEVEPCI